MRNKRTRDLSEAQFRRALERAGFKEQPYSFMGYCEVVEGPCKGMHISRFNGGDRRRSQLAYLIQQKNYWENKKGAA